MADPISANPNKCDLFVRVREYQAEKRVGTPSQSINAAPIFTNYCNAEDLRRLTIIPHEKYADHWIGKYITIVLVSAPKPSVNAPIPPDEVDPNMGLSNIQCSEERLSPFVNTDLTRLTRKSILSLSRLAHDYGQQEYTFSDSEAEIASSSSLITNIRDTYSIRSGDVVTFLNNLLGTSSSVVEDLRNDSQAMATLKRIYI